MTSSYGASVYVSYARKDEEQHGAVAKLYEAFEDQWVCLKVDADVVKPRESFKDFIEEIGKADCIVVMFSEAYFESFYCMLELTRIMEAENASARVLPIFVDSSFRLDNKQRQLKKHWERKVTEWQEPYDANEECAEEYGSEAECQAIVNQCDAIFSEFAFDQAYQIKQLFGTNFLSIINESKKLYFDKCEKNPAFNKATAYFKNCSEETKLALRSQINEQDVALKDEDVISHLVQNHLHSLLDIFSKSQASISSPERKKSLGQLLNFLLPLMIDPSYVESFKSERGVAKIIAIPYAQDISAEILMASADHRALEIAFREKSEVTRKLEAIPGRYHLKQPPEAGDNGLRQQLHDFEEDILMQNGEEPGYSFDLFENLFFKAFVSKRTTPERWTTKERVKLIKNGLDKEKYHYYWIMPVNKNELWSDFAKKVQDRYPKIVFLELDTDIDRYLHEDNLLDPLPQLINH